MNSKVSYKCDDCGEIISYTDFWHDIENHTLLYPNDFGCPICYGDLTTISYDELNESEM